MNTDPLTPVDYFDDGYWCKREDLAGWERPDWPSGAKVRQYIKMIQAQPGKSLLVGCSAFSAMPIYIAGAASKFALPANVFVPGRAKESDSVQYARRMGVTVHEVRPCPGPNVYRARAREFGKAMGGGSVKWDFMGALHDAKHQAQNIPGAVRRVIVPTGSGLIAAGVLAGLAGRSHVEVLAVSGSTMAHEDKILANARKVATEPLPPFKLVRSSYKYEQYSMAQLPDGTPMDPFYSAKLLPFLRTGDCMWLTGLRPVCSMPKDCQEAFKSWNGPK